MGNIKKTLSYIKRNGIKKTYYRIVEQKRLDREFADYNEDRKKELASAEELAKQSGTSFSKKILISIIVPLYNTDEIYLRAMIDSVLLQSYENWELILPDGTKDDSCLVVVSEYDDERIKYYHLDQNKGISENTNAGIRKATGDVIAFMDHDDYIEPDALYYIADAFCKGALCVYTDEDKVSGNGNNYFMPHRKLDFNYDLILSNNYICHMFAVDADIAASVGFLRKEYDGAQDFDFILRCVEKVAQENGGSYKQLDRLITHIPKILYHWRCYELSTADNPDSKLYAYEAGKRAVSTHLKRRGIAAVVSHTDHLGFYHVTYEDIFMRPEVGAYIGRREKLKKYEANDGPFLRDEKGNLYNPFEGLKVYESGYMHRAKMQMDVADAWRDYGEVRKECQDMKTEDISKSGMLIVYDPEKIV